MAAEPILNTAEDRNLAQHPFRPILSAILFIFASDILVQGI